VLQVIFLWKNTDFFCCKKWGKMLSCEVLAAIRIGRTDFNYQIWVKPSNNNYLLTTIFVVLKYTCYETLTNGRYKKPIFKN